MFAVMNVERGKFEGEETPEEAAEKDARARAEISAGRVYSNEEVVAWLKTWGTPDRKPLRRRWPR
ncbi:antitoxin [Sphingomonas bacterium]|uniref:antitoxin n=1 Tax=Sphingomonas bacterium TaxID=1895847 RepID=UPI0020C71FFE|nr:antitoxin [Sphingomonas bacterium]